MFIAEWNKIKKLIDRCAWYYKADLDISKSYISSYNEEDNRVKRLDSFYFYVKQPRSKSYQCHSSIEPTKPILENLISSVQETIEKGKHFQLEVYIGLGIENVFIHKSLLNKLLIELNKMLIEITSEGDQNVTNQ